MYYTDPKGADPGQGIIWDHWLGMRYSLKASTMWIRNKNVESSLKTIINMVIEAIDKIKEEITSLQDRHEESTKEYMESRDKMYQEITFLKDENEELQKANQKIESSLKIVPAFLSKDWKVQKRNLKL